MNMLLATLGDPIWQIGGVILLLAALVLSIHGLLEQEEQHFRLGMTLLRLRSLVRE